MRYYRVKPEYDNIYDYSSGYTTIENELLTRKERDKQFPSLRDKVFEEVEISQRKIYWFFGARFEIK